MDIPSQDTQGWRGRMFIHEWTVWVGTGGETDKETEREMTTRYVVVETQRFTLQMKALMFSTAWNLFSRVKFVALGTGRHQRHEDQAGVTHPGMTATQCIGHSKDSTMTVNQQQQAHLSEPAIPDLFQVEKIVAAQVCGFQELNWRTREEKVFQWWAVFYHQMWGDGFHEPHWLAQSLPIIWLGGSSTNMC